MQLEKGDTMKAERGLRGFIALRFEEYRNQQEKLIELALEMKLAVTRRAVQSAITRYRNQKNVPSPAESERIAREILSQVNEQPLPQPSTFASPTEERKKADLEAAVYRIASYVSSMGCAQCPQQYEKAALARGMDGTTLFSEAELKAAAIRKNLFAREMALTDE